jgi:NADPH:quinone reductase-like Zn-dependent oxidoreductase
MKAIEINEYGGEDLLQVVDIPKPQAGTKQIVARVIAATLNPIDIKLTSGHMRQIMPLHFPFVPGQDFSGVVDSVGEGVKEYKPGDEVFGYSPSGGSYAEYIAIDADKIAPKPNRLSYIEAASLALVAQTAFEMVERANVQRGQTVLIQGAGGAVGGIAVQEAHRRGATVIATAAPSAFARLKEYGADRVIDYKTERFEDYAKNVDAVLDAVGGEVQQRSFTVLKPGGVLIAVTQPPSEEEAKKHQVRALMFSTEAKSENLRAIAQLADAGEIKPFIGKTYPLTEAAQAWRDARTGKVEGKLVFQVAAGASEKSQKASAS